jgi:hypothetical protein
MLHASSLWQDLLACLDPLDPRELLEKLAARARRDPRALMASRGYVVLFFLCVFCCGYTLQYIKRYIYFVARF